MLSGVPGLKDHSHILLFFSLFPAFTHVFLPHSALHHLWPVLQERLSQTQTPSRDSLQVGLHGWSSWTQWCRVALLPQGLISTSTPLLMSLSVFEMPPSPPTMSPPRTRPTFVSSLLCHHLHGASPIHLQQDMILILQQSGGLHPTNLPLISPAHDLTKSPWRRSCSLCNFITATAPSKIPMSVESSNACWIGFLSSAFDHLKDCSSKLAKSNDGRNSAGEAERVCYFPRHYPSAYTAVLTHALLMTDHFRAKSCCAEGSDSSHLLGKHTLKHICLHKRLHICFFFHSGRIIQHNSTCLQSNPNWTWRLQEASFPKSICTHMNLYPCGYLIVCTT